MHTISFNLTRRKSDLKKKKKKEKKRTKKKKKKNKKNIKEDRKIVRNILEYSPLSEAVLLSFFHSDFLLEPFSLSR